MSTYSTLIQYIVSFFFIFSYMYLLFYYFILKYKLFNLFYYYVDLKVNLCIVFTDIINLPRLSIISSVKYNLNQ